MGLGDEMLYWFDWYLKGEGRAPTLGVEMQDNRGGWRFEETYPPMDVENLVLTGSDLAPTGSTVSSTSTVTLSYGPFEEERASSECQRSTLLQHLDSMEAICSLK